MTPRDKEKLDVLAGERGDKSQSAVRLASVQALVNNISVDPSGDTDADIKALFACINALRIALR
jgi:hypothetical protein